MRMLRLLVAAAVVCAAWVSTADAAGQAETVLAAAERGDRAAAL